MAVLIPDEVLQQAGVTEERARIEAACRLYDADFLTLHQGMRLAGLSRADFWLALKERGLPMLHLGDEMLEDVEGLKPLGEDLAGGR
jgi:predicted HTH domain antitoxin